MVPSHVCALYVVAGVLCGGFVLVRAPCPRRRHVWTALATVPLWPLWAPLALAAFAAARARHCGTVGHSRPMSILGLQGHARGGAPLDRRRSDRPRTHRAVPILSAPGPGWDPLARSNDDPCERTRRIRIALEGALEAVARSPLEQLLCEDDVARLLAETRVLAERLDAFDRMGAGHRWSDDQRARRATAAGDGSPLEGPDPEPRDRPPSAARARSMARLARAHRRTRHALAELGDLVEALHAELLLLRLGQPAAEEVDVALPQPNEPCAKRTPELGTCDEVAGCEIVLSLLDRIDAVIAHARPERLTSLPDWTTPPAAE